MSVWWALVVFAIFFIGVTKSGFGSGVGLMIVPMTTIGMAHIDPEHGSQAALGLLLPLLVFGDLVAVWQYRRLFSLQIVKHLLPGTAVGVVAAALLLTWFHHHSPEVVASLIRIEVGLESIILVSLHWWRLWRGVQKQLMPEPWRSHLTGAFSAASSTLAHAAGPIVAMYLLPLKLDRKLFVGTCAIYFFLLNSAKLPAYYAAGMFKYARVGFTFRFIPLVAAGALFGLWINKRMSDTLFIRIVYIITFCLGWYILVDGTLTLIHHQELNMASHHLTALVTGALRGIGRGIALALAKEKFNVVVNYASNVQAAEIVKAEIETVGVKAHLVQADIASSADRKRLAEEAAGVFGGIDLLVNNAGIAPSVRADLLDASEESFDRLIGTNLKGPYFLTQLVARGMIEAIKNGAAYLPKIVNITSISAYTASVNRGDYCVAKAGLSMMTQLYAARLAEHGINVYEIRPGIIETDMTGPVKAKYDKLILEDGITPIRRWGKPEDIGRMVVAVARDLLPFSTGEVLNVDGGFHLRRL